MNEATCHTSRTLKCLRVLFSTFRVPPPRFLSVIWSKQLSPADDLKIESKLRLVSGFIPATRGNESSIVCALIAKANKSALYSTFYLAASLARASKSTRCRLPLFSAMFTVLFPRRRFVIFHFTTAPLFAAHGTVDPTGVTICDILPGNERRTALPMAVFDFFERAKATLLFMARAMYKGGVVYKRRIHPSNAISLDIDKSNDKSNETNRIEFSGDCNSASA